MNHASGSTLSPFATGLVPAGFDDQFLRTDYDANGNRDSSGYTVGTGGTLTASPNATYTYDAAGHLTARTDTSTGKVTTFAYDHRDRLTGITRKTSGGTVDYRTTYVYDALNRRIAEQVDADGAGAGSPVTTWTVFDGQNPYADFNGAGSLTQRYLHGAAVDALLARSDASGVTDLYLTDRLGSVRDIVDTSGTVLYHTGYDSFGNKVSSSGSGGDRFGFTGREHDAALNLYYYRARFYDPTTGRFLSKDPLGFEAGDTNLYRYVGNGPQNAVDPSGMDSIKVMYVTRLDGSNAVDIAIFGDVTAEQANDIKDYAFRKWREQSVIKIGRTDQLNEVPDIQSGPNGIPDAPRNSFDQIVFPGKPAYDHQPGKGTNPRNAFRGIGIGRGHGQYSPPRYSPPSHTILPTPLNDTFPLRPTFAMI